MGDTPSDDYLSKHILPNLAKLFIGKDGAQTGVPAHLEEIVRGLDETVPMHHNVLALSRKSSHLIGVRPDAMMADPEFRWHLLYKRLALGEDGQLYRVVRMTLDKGSKPGTPRTIPVDLSPHTHKNANYDDTWKAVEALIALGVNMKAVAAFLDEKVHAHTVGGCPLDALRQKWLSEHHNDFYRLPKWDDMMVHTESGPRLRADGTMCVRLGGRWTVYHAESLVDGEHHAASDASPLMQQYMRLWCASGYFYSSIDRRMRKNYEMVVDSKYRDVPAGQGVLLHDGDAYPSRSDR